MKELLAQIIRFGIVGCIAFLIDFTIYTFMCNVLGIHYIIAGFFGFTISLIANYILSMKFVFEGKEDVSKKREFVIFVVLSVIGLGLNELILFVCIDGIYQSIQELQQLITVAQMNVMAKIIATGIVMVYNFITRKIFLEKKPEKNN